MGLLVKSVCRDLILSVEEAVSGLRFLGDRVVSCACAICCAAAIVANEHAEVELRKFGGRVTSQMIVLKVEGVATRTKWVLSAPEIIVRGRQHAEISTEETIRNV
jgi:hypothetical protein